MAAGQRFKFETLKSNDRFSDTQRCHGCDFSGLARALLSQYQTSSIGRPRTWLISLYAGVAVSIKACSPVM